MTEHRRIFRFAVVGTGVAAYYMVTYLGLLHLLGSPWIANLLAFGSAILIQYVGQTAWTFGKPLAAPAQFGRFLCMIGVGLVVSSALTGIVGPRLGLPETVSAASVVVVLPILNFVILRLWVYRERNSI
ncbi:GtrA family protein [Ruegeria sp. MALMAid1280]|uniref:GtrA family protein n=1 Tax=Ruegeria sp. MALMAid1280 TaxID=3411634 RepID=UPI003BA025EB